MNIAEEIMYLSAAVKNLTWAARAADEEDAAAAKARLAKVENELDELIEQQRSAERKASVKFLMN